MNTAILFAVQYVEVTSMKTKKIPKQSTDNSGKKISRIVVYYDDGTYEERSSWPDTIPVGPAPYYQPVILPVVPYPYYAPSWPYTVTC